MTTTATRRRKTSHHEGGIARSMGQHARKVPSDALLWSAVGSITTLLVVGLYRRFMKR